MDEGRWQPTSFDAVEWAIQDAPKMGAVASMVGNVCVPSALRRQSMCGCHSAFVRQGETYNRLSTEGPLMKTFTDYAQEKLLDLFANHDHEVGSELKKLEPEKPE